MDRPAPIDQPRKPRKVEDILEECVQAVVTHDHPRRVVARLFAEQQVGIEFHKETRDE